MSLEKAILENTETLKQLIAVIEAAGAVGVQGSNKAKVEHPVGKNAAPEKAKPAAPAALVYADIQKPFLKLVQTNRDAAVALLAELGAPSLKAFEGQPEKFAEILAAIKKAGG